MLNKKQKLVIVVTILLLVLSFIVPPWGDYFPTSSNFEIHSYTGAIPSGEESFVRFIGYGWLFDRPDHYLHEFHRKVEYTEEAQRAMRSRKIFTGEESNPLIRIRVPSGLDSIALISRYDSMIDAGTIVTMENDQLLGFAGIYHELLIIQLVLLILISISLIYIFKK